APVAANAPQGGNPGGGQNVAPPLPPHGAPQGGNPAVQAAAPAPANAPQDGNTGAAQAAAPAQAGAPQDGNTGAAPAAAPVPANAPQDGNSSATQATVSSQRGVRLSGNSRGDQDKEIYQPGVPLYSGLASIVHRLNGIAGLFERGADRYWRGAGAANIVEGDGPGTLTAASDPTRREMVTDAGLVWGRIETAHTNANLYESTTSNRYEMDSWKIRAGIDNQFLETEHGRLIGSAWFEYSNVKADLLSFFGNGRINVNGNALGTSLTWFGDSGLYLDAQAQALWTKSDISSSTLNRNLVNSVKGKGYALSVEAGQVYAINQAWTLIPNGQITWSQTSLDEFSDPFYAQVSFDRPQALTARGGIRIEYGQSWLDSQGFMNRGKLYGSAHLSHEFWGRNSGMLVSQEKIKLGHEGRSWGELGLGGVYSFQNDKFSIFGEFGFGGYLHDLAESYSLRSNLGFRVKW
ncbi:autotransporter outer membrane beta-barrel domain-containing protein, partial [Falsochrobactrum ovis]